MIFARRMAALAAAVATLCPAAFAGQLGLPLLAKGSDLINRGNYTGAISVLSAAVRQDPSDLEVRRRLSSAYIGAGMARQALQQLEAVSRVSPGNAGDYVMMAEAHFQMGDTAKAIARYKQAMLTDPSNTQARMGLARALMAAGDLNSASAVCNDSIRTKQDAQSRQQFVELLGTIRSRGNVVHRQLNG